MAKLRTLGGLALEPATFTQPRPLLLLAYLCVMGPQPRSRLAELLWPEGDRMKSLSMALSRLRSGVPGAVAAEGGTIRAVCESDVAELVHALEQRRWKRAADLYRGAFLEGVRLHGAGYELEEWLVETREGLAGRVQHALLKLAEGALARGDAQEAGALAGRAYSLPGAANNDPAQLDRLHGLLRASGSAMAAPLEAEVAEAEWSGAVPRAARSSPPRRRLPVPGTSFVGREAELELAASSLARPECRLLTIVGAGGCGKSRLAHEIARERLDSGAHPDGVALVMLATIAEPDEVPFQVARALGHPLQDGADPWQGLAASLAEERTLLVLDNFEHLQEAAPRLPELLEACPGVKLLVTSRERLALREEHLLPLGGLPWPAGPASWEDAMAFGAVRLFAERVWQLRPRMDLAPEVASVVELCGLLEGSPLAIELAAGWVPTVPCGEIVASLRRDPDFLRADVSNVPDRHRSLRALFEGSWRLLSDSQRTALRRLAVFRGGFRAEAAAAVAEALRPTLTALVDKSLVRSGGGGRFDLHPLVRHYAMEQLGEAGELEATASLHARYYLGLVRRQADEVLRGRQRAALLVFQEEWENCAAVPEWVLEQGDMDALLEWVELVDTFYDVRGAYAQALGFLERAEERAGRLGRHDLRGRVLLERGWCLLWLGQPDAARRAVEAGLALLPPAAVAWRARGLNTLGIGAYNQGRHEEAKGLWEEALRLAREAGFAVYEAHVNGNLGLVAMELDDLPAAERHHLRSLELYERLGAVNGTARESTNVAVTYLAQGRLDDALAAARRGVATTRELDYRLHLAYALSALAAVERARARHDEAAGLEREALALSRETGDKSAEVEALIGLATAEAALGRRVAAQAALDDALAVAELTGSAGKRAEALVVQAELWAAAGKRAAAAQLLHGLTVDAGVPPRVRRAAEEALERSGG